MALFNGVSRSFPVKNKEEVDFAAVHGGASQGVRLSGG